MTSNFQCCSDTRLETPNISILYTPLYTTSYFRADDTEGCSGATAIDTDRSNPAYVLQPRRHNQGGQPRLCSHTRLHCAHRHGLASRLPTRPRLAHLQESVQTHETKPETCLREEEKWRSPEWNRDGRKSRKSSLVRTDDLC